ncbi:hypothetical protein Skr01_33370 [Sphaerisporangium krabiense]|uniref:Glycolipid-binding domain-containing protein n=1 Tax=Sphaerisporangium krabiense TaxID=763782 RepID=A0A7W8Z386_9ACTN|nr:putative glycolipid-binding domain-containing protein [Sphaerisporangium krabiense]MBB5626338.1 hypothetical protein [Sphaerisporangium krabiense]GII63252.1 hypothetical protein Skr01_33370 [Sphaerisporangium krabiense]
MPSIVWVKDEGAEYAHVELSGGRLSAVGTAVGGGPVPYRLEYELLTGPRYVTAVLTVRSEGAGWTRSLDLRRGVDGAWSIGADASGALEGAEPGGDASLLDGALDCDLGLSPLTNSMPVLRHAMLGGGDPVDLTMAWVSVPHLAVVRDAQRYTPLGGGVVRYESDGFRADIAFGSEGLVATYPGIARQVTAS